MLVLTRKPGEALMIGSVRVYFQKVKGDHVQVAIDAPRSTPVDREEVFQSKLKDDNVRQAPPTGVFKDGELFQVEGRLYWSPPQELGMAVEVSDMIGWRFREGTPVEKMIVRVGPLEDAKR